MWVEHSVYTAGGRFRANSGLSKQQLQHPEMLNIVQLSLCVWMHGKEGEREKKKTSNLFNLLEKK